jgi:glycosyltransferase
MGTTKISIITVSYNSKDTIEDTILSVLGQTYENIEYIIIDGASKDGTLEIIEKYKDKISIFISEPDNGIYDAFNKGIKVASGNVIGILNSDDIYISNNAISKIMNVFAISSSETVYADLIYADKNNLNKFKRYFKSKPYNINKIKYGWMPPHPTFFVKKEIYNKFGIFNDSLSISADYELIIRFLYKNNVTTEYLNEVIVLMRTGGNSNGSIKVRINANIQDRQAWRLNNLTPPFFGLILKPLLKIKQYYIPIKIRKLYNKFI